MKRVEHTLYSGAKVIGYLRENSGKSLYSTRPAIVVYPGGGYFYRSERENEPVVLEFLSRGYQVFVLEYSVGEDLEKGEPEKEGAEAVAWIRENAGALEVVEDQIALLGFSAGGHAALSLCCHSDYYGASSRPDAAILSYPVVTMGEYTHAGTRDNITKGERERMEYFSLETQVTPSIPPLFIWHTTEDTSVPPMNTILLVSALESVKATYEYHLYQRGKHGLSTCRREVGPPEERTERWIEEADSWLKDLFSFRQ